jgi:hypothetical protein
MAKGEFDKVRVMIKDLITLEAGHPINYGRDVGHYSIQISRWDDAKSGKEGIPKIEIRDLNPYGKGIALSWKELRNLGEGIAKILKMPEVAKLVIADYDAPKPAEKSERAKAIEAAEAKAAEAEARNAELEARLAKMELAMAEKLGVLS